MKKQNIDPVLVGKISNLYRKHVALKRRSAKKFVKSYFDLFLPDPHPAGILEGLLYCLADAARSGESKNIDFVENVTQEIFDQLGDYSGDMPFTMIMLFILQAPANLLLYLPMLLVCTPVVGIITDNHDKDFKVSRITAIAVSDMKVSDKRFALEWATRGIWSGATDIANRMHRRSKRQKQKKE